MARRIQKKIPVVPMGENGLGRKHRDASGPLHGGKVHTGSAVIHPAHGPQRPTPVQQLFRQSGFAAVHLGQNPQRHIHSTTSQPSGTPSKQRADQSISGAALGNAPGSPGAHSRFSYQ